MEIHITLLSLSGFFTGAIGDVASGKFLELHDIAGERTRLITKNILDLPQFFI